MAENNNNNVEDNGTGRRTHLKVDWKWLEEWAKSDPYRDIYERNARISGNQEETENNPNN